MSEPEREAEPDQTAKAPNLLRSLGTVLDRFLSDETDQAVEDARDLVDPLR